MRRHPAIHRHRLEGRQAEVVVRVDEPGEQRATCQVDDRCLRSDIFGDFGAGSDCNNVSPLHGHGLSPAMQGIHSQNVPTHQHQIHHPPPGFFVL
jgi:hypothetical protein